MILAMIAVQEPMTLLTDYLLGVLSTVLAIRMLRRGSVPSRRWWAAALASCALAAFSGGTFHGFLPWLSDRLAATLWTVTLAAIGAASFAAVMATATRHWPLSWRRGTATIVAVKFGIYVAWIVANPIFIAAIFDYSVSFLVVLGVHLNAWRRTGDRDALIVVIGVLVSFVAAGIQALGISPHDSFNHNDLYHVVQMAGTWLLYRGAVGPDSAGSMDLIPPSRERPEHQP